MPPWMIGCSIPKSSVILVFMVRFTLLWRNCNSARMPSSASSIALHLGSRIGYPPRSVIRSEPALQKPVRKLRVAATEHGEWTPAASAELYGIKNWGAGYFDINDAGEVTVHVPADGALATVSLMEIIRGMQQRKLTMPVLLRLDNLLEAQIVLLNNTFAKAIQTLGYKAEYRGVFPIKVNQQ